MNTPESQTVDPAKTATAIRAKLPAGGLFAEHQWRVSPVPFSLGPGLTKEIESLGRVLLQFYKAANLLYRQSVAGKQPPLVAEWLDRGKPPELVELQRSATQKSEFPRVIRPDLLLTDHSVSVTELDSVPGGIGLTAWLNQTYSDLGFKVVGGCDGMLTGFAGIFGGSPNVHVVVSEESATYRPEMQWLCAQLGGERFQVRDSHFTNFQEGDAAYRFFELFDASNIPAAAALFQLAAEKKIRLTAPPKPLFEEKMLFALLWNRNLRGFWRQELGESSCNVCRKSFPTPGSWIQAPCHRRLPSRN